MRIRKKTFILIVTYFSAAVIALGVYSYVQSAEGASYRRTAEYGYSHAFSEVVLEVDKLDTALRKASYAKGQEISMTLCGDIYSSCLAAEMTLAALPFSSYELEKTAAFIGICGDYAASLLKSCAQTGFGDTERQSISELAEMSGDLSAELADLQSSVINGDVIMDAPEKLTQKTDKNSLLSIRMKAYEETVGALPELFYDGVYSEYGSFSAKDGVSEEAALAAAAEFSGIDGLKTEFHSENGSYGFSFDGGSIVVDSSGRVQSLSSSRSVAGDMDNDELTAAATEVLKSAGFERMRLMSSYRSDSVLTASFAPITESGTLLSGAVVRVSIAADNGELYAFNAVEYYENFSEDCDLTPAVSRETAAEALPDGLTVNDCAIELRRFDGGSRLCYDFSVSAEDGTALSIIVDAESGRQLDIVIPDDN